MLFESTTRPVPRERDEAATEPIPDLPLFPEHALRQESGEDTVPAAAIEAESEAAQDSEQATIPVDDSSVHDHLHPRAAPFWQRFRAAALDGIVMLAALVTLIAGGVLLGAPADLRTLPYYLPTWLVLSFVYHVVPIFFWGRTPGMAYAEVMARSDDEGPVTLAQSARRWLAGLATMLLLGVPGLMSLRGRSLADRASRTTTLVTS